VCARSCAHIYDVRKRKGVVVYLNVNNNNDIQNNDIYIYTHTHNYKAMHTIDATNFNRTYRFDERAR